MKFIVLIIIILIEVTVSAATNKIGECADGALIKRTYIRGFRTLDHLDARKDLTCPVNVLGNICANDCLTLMMCQTGSTIPIYTVNCAAVSESAPYCIPGSSGCIAIVNYNHTRCIATQKSTFECTSIGYFPDPSNCTLYHICTSEFQETYQCPPDYVFDATNTRCQSKKHGKGCFTIDCSNSPNQYVPYQGDKSYYAFCGKENLTMFKCGDSNHFEFNPKTENCEFVCKSSGWFPNYENCQQYYECYKGETCSECDDKVFKRRIQTCPPNFIFDVKRRQCVEGDCITNTTTSRPEYTINSTTPVMTTAALPQEINRK